ncbi:MAG: S-adenosylmethionine:tRNA ribosyltransferase-isomerase [Rikenellaceae bacterium]|nr:S-adenosylmethionine:tRNA ribosyltransferase-isomerase [Rikenellaceae bacterium]
MQEIKIEEFNYDLPDHRIAKFPVENRAESKLLVRAADGTISHTVFNRIGERLPEGTMLVFNNTRVVRARVIMHKPTGARVEVLCLEPCEPADYERAFAARGECKWHCIVGGLKKWKEGPVQIPFEDGDQSYTLQAWREEQTDGSEQIVRFEWDAPMTFGQMLELLGRLPIPPYLNRDTQEVDYTRYQTVYSKFEGSVAAPTAGLHFTQEVIEQLREQGVETEEVTLHVGAGTFLPVKAQDATQHPMHTEHFEVKLSSIESLIRKNGNVTAVGTTSVRTLESLPALGFRVLTEGNPHVERVIGQFELYDIPTERTGVELLQALADYMRNNGVETLKAATRIMIVPSFKFRVVNQIITNFHQPKSTLLLLISAFIGEEWRKVYRYAMDNDFRFLSYGDSSLLFGQNQGANFEVSEK